VTSDGASKAPRSVPLGNNGAHGVVSDGLVTVNRMDLSASRATGLVTDLSKFDIEAQYRRPVAIALATLLDSETERVALIAWSQRDQVEVLAQDGSRLIHVHVGADGTTARAFSRSRVVAVEASGFDEADSGIEWLVSKWTLVLDDGTTISATMNGYSAERIGDYMRELLP